MAALLAVAAVATGRWRVRASRRCCPSPLKERLPLDNEPARFGCPPGWEEVLDGGGRRPKKKWIRANSSSGADGGTGGGGGGGGW